MFKEQQGGLCDQRGVSIGESSWRWGQGGDADQIARKLVGHFKKVALDFEWVGKP